MSSRSCLLSFVLCGVLSWTPAIRAQDEAPPQPAANPAPTEDAKSPAAAEMDALIEQGVFLRLFAALPTSQDLAQARAFAAEHARQRRSSAGAGDPVFEVLGQVPRGPSRQHLAASSAWLLRAALDEPDPRNPRSQMAQSVINDLESLDFESPADETFRRILLAHARSLKRLTERADSRPGRAWSVSGEPGDATELLNSGVDLTSLPIRLRAHAILAMNLFSRTDASLDRFISATVAGPLAPEPGQPPQSWLVELTFDAWLRATLRAWRMGGSNALLGRAQSLMESAMARLAATGDPDEAFDRLLDKVAIALEGRQLTSIESTPPLILLAWANRAGAQDDPAGTIRALDAAATGLLGTRFHQEALECLGMALAASTEMDHTVRAVEVWTEIARRSEAEQENPALAKALELGRAVAGYSDRANLAYEQALTLALESSSVMSSDELRLELAALLLRDMPDATQLMRGLDVLGPISPESSSYEQAERMIAGHLRSWLDRALFDVKQAYADERNPRDVAARVVPVAQRAVAWAAAANRPEANAFQLDLADAQIDAGSPDAHEQFKALAAIAGGDLTAAPSPQPPIEGWPERIWLGLARAELASDQPGEGVARLRTLTEYLEARSLYSDHFWHAWALRLEHDPEFADAARRIDEINRLKEIDANLGNAPWRRIIGERAGS